ncbi:MAG: N-acetylmuramoyl-L-alanine amidase [Oceanospirillaceae bacterium]|nr:N-acetylmuramoyl-L-alanine amidase [Oceanospirillaceae bacterium]
MRLLLLLFLAYFSTSSIAAKVENIRIWPAPDNTRVVLDISAEVTFEQITLANPDRLVIDIDKSTLSTTVAKLDFSNSPIRGLRSSQRSGNKLRLVLDLAYKTSHKIFSLPPNASYGHRLVIDLSNYQLPKPTPAKGAVKKTTPTLTSGDEKASPPKSTLNSLSLLDSQRDIIIAIDAGHGGEDPGALGPRYGGQKLREKHVVLGIAKELQTLIKKEPGFEPLLTRTGDYYVSLRGRTKKARNAQADLFISIHADAFKNSKARGASVWILSSSGASSEMGRLLAQKENEADLIGGIGGISLEDKEDDVAMTLIDMSMNYSQSAGSGVAKEVLNNIGKIARLHKNHVEKAGFVVLKSPDVPSILVETGFISNPGEAAKLRTKKYQKQMANAIFNGLKNYFYSHPIANTYVASVVEAKRKQLFYKVVSGDTLSAIAQRFGTSVKQLQSLNNMTSTSVLKVGKKLTIPKT